MGMAENLPGPATGAQVLSERCEFTGSRQLIVSYLEPVRQECRPLRRGRV